VSGNRSSRTNGNGFSLFELLIVLVIGSFAIALAGTLAGKSLARTEGRGIVRRLAAELRYARSQAIQSGRSHRVGFDSERRSYTLSDPTRAISLPEGWYFLDLERMPTSGERESGVVFYPDGSTTGGEIHIGREANRFVIIVDPLLGEVRVEESS
jgi:general secretion pathway protein H